MTMNPFRPLQVLVSLILLSVGAYYYLRAPDHVYPLPMREAHRILEKTNLPPMVLGTTPPAFEVKSADPARIVWAVKRGNVVVLNFIAELSAFSETATRVEIKIAAPGAGPAAAEMERRINEHLTIKQLYLIAMDEQVAAALEHRNFNMAKVAAPTMIATLANMPEMMQNLERGMEADHKRMKSNIAKAYADEAAGLR